MKHLINRLCRYCFGKMPLSHAQPANPGRPVTQYSARCAVLNKAPCRSAKARFYCRAGSAAQAYARAEAGAGADSGGADRLKVEFDRQQTALAEVEAELEQRSGNLGELFEWLPGRPRHTEQWQKFAC